MGDFSFVNDAMWREVLTHDYACVTFTEWLMLKGHDADNSFMWDTNGPAWDMLRAKLYDGHSGASMACSLRTLECIAKSGWDSFVKTYKQ